MCDSKIGRLRRIGEMQCEWLMVPHGKWRLIRTTCACLGLGLAAWIAVTCFQYREPRYQGHRLSEWLDAMDANNRFADRPERRSAFTDEEIDQALHKIGRKAVPHLLRWLQAKKPWWQVKLEALQKRRHVIYVRFQDPWTLENRALNGFLCLGAEAREAWPALLRLTQSRDPGLRLSAYEAYFFSRPEKEDFLRVAVPLLSRRDKDLEAVAAQWTIQRFPAEADKLGLRQRFARFYAGVAASTNDAAR
jgi:hypothetical protein